MQLWRGRKSLLWRERREIFLLRGNVMAKTRVLFICTANAARSQMAEGLLRAKYGERYEVFSAGTRQSKVSTRAITVMQEIEIDISHHRSKTLAELEGEPFDLAVTLCDNAHAVCPIVPGARKTIHKGFADPHQTPGTEAEILDAYRKVRDAISIWIDTTFSLTPVLQ
jgi:arsenate reductase